MRTLLILRHGKAAPEEAGSDAARPLTERGMREAKQMGQLLLSEDLVPDRILASRARRARETASQAAAASHFSGAIDELQELYLAEPEAYISAVRRHAPDARRVLLVGHNPGLEALALILTGDPVSLPPAGLVVCTLPIASFAELAPQVRGKMARFVRPSELSD
ncbi:MAG TPA: histidine phosphatase family protein [Polyangiaceae bacterium]|nr:histidine phosphatase family protein [Polyangiaceae bacterium]